MIKLEFDEKSVFAINSDEQKILVFDHSKGKFEGPVEGPIAEIKFDGMWQLYHFKEMLDLMLEKVKK